MSVQMIRLLMRFAINQIDDKIDQNTVQNHAKLKNFRTKGLFHDLTVWFNCKKTTRTFPNIV